MVIRNLSENLKHNVSQTFDLYNEFNLILNTGVCKGAYRKSQRLPNYKQIIKDFKRQIRYIRLTLKQFSFPELIITPLGKSLEEIIFEINSQGQITLDTRFGINTFNDLNGQITYYPSYNTQSPIHQTSKLDLINEIEGIFEVSMLNKEPLIHSSKTPFEVHSSTLHHNITSLTLEDFICFYIKEKYFQNLSINFETPTLITNSRIDATNEFFLCYENSKSELIITTAFMFNKINYEFQTLNKLIL